MEKTLLRSELPGLPPPRRGKVRDVYDLGDELLLVATDRLSAFDVILPRGIPDKGRVLTGLSRFWFEHFGDRVRHHVLDSSWTALPAAVRRAGDLYRGRVLRVRKAEPLPVEWIVRGYMVGSLWEQYRRGEPHFWVTALPAGLRAGDPLPAPLFTPYTKTVTGHDRPLTREDLVARVGAERAAAAERLSLELFRAAAAYARERGVLLVDTKLEWGLVQGELTLIDECFTPDSSRFVLTEQHRPGEPMEPYDKELVRRHLRERGWRGEGPPPDLPPAVVTETWRRYLVIHRRLTGGLPEGVGAEPFAPEEGGW